MVRSWKLSSALVVFLLALTVVTPISISSTASDSNSGNEGMWIYFFYGDGCPHCAIVEPLIESLAAKYPQVNFIKLEVWYNSSNKALFQDFYTRYEIKYPAVPAVFIADQALIREEPIQNNLEASIQYIISTNNSISPLKYSASEASIKQAHPELNFTTANGAVFNSSQVVIGWNYISGQSNVAMAEVTIDGGTFQPISRDAKSYVVGGLSEGNHTFILRIIDSNGLSSEHTLNITVDLGLQSDISSVPSSPLPLGFAVFILILGISLAIIRIKRKAP